MNIAMFTNTFTPHVGGVARSVESFTGEYRRRGHRVLVVAPEFADMPPDEVDVVRVPAIQNFNATDFSVALPVSGLLTGELEAFQPDIVHSHHPFLLGMTALRVARYRNLPLVFTHHTFYEHYTQYVPGDSVTLKRFVIELATRYANLADRVFAPSESVAGILRERGVRTPIVEMPTGVETERFARGDGAGFRRARGIGQDTFVVGHVGRLAPEKNLEFLAESVAAFLRQEKRARFLVVGVGPSEPAIREIFSRESLGERLHFAGILKLPDLADALHAMNLFAFASKSETQGMVLAEAMAAGVPVVALDAPGAREIIRDKGNGRLVRKESISAFASALRWAARLPAGKMQRLFGRVHGRSRGSPLLPGRGGMGRHQPQEPRAADRGAVAHQCRQPAANGRAAARRVRPGGRRLRARTSARPQPGQGTQVHSNTCRDVHSAARAHRDRREDGHRAGTAGRAPQPSRVRRAGAPPGPGLALCALDAQGNRRRHRAHLARGPALHAARLRCLDLF